MVSYNFSLIYIGLKKLHRPDKFIAKHIPYLEGEMKIAIAHLKFPTGDAPVKIQDEIGDENEIPPADNDFDVVPSYVRELEFEEIQDPEENWKNKNKTATSQSVVTLEKSKARQRRSNYSILNAQKINLRDPIPLLKNGFSDGGKKTFNTCAFDSIFSFYACLYQDYGHIRGIIDSEKSSSEMCAFIAKALEPKKNQKKKKNMKEKVPKPIYNERNNILFRLAGHSEKQKQFTSLDCEIGFGEVFSKLCRINEVLASFITNRTCHECFTAVKLVRPLLPLFVRGMNISDLQPYIIDPNSEDIFCPDCKNICEAEHRFNPVLALEVEPISNKAKTQFRVADVTKRIEVGDEIYNLCGAIESKSKHFVCHMLRQSAVWETYDDMNENVSTLNPTKEINIFMLFYIRSGEFSEKYMFYIELLHCLIARFRFNSGWNKHLRCRTPE